MPIARLLPALFATLMLLAGCATTGGSRDAAAAHAVILLQNNGLLRDPELQTYVESVAERVLAVAPEIGPSASIYLLDTERANAFVTEFGGIYVTRGLLGMANSEAELAAVLAHEAAHLVAGHPAARDVELDRVDAELAARLPTEGPFGLGTAEREAAIAAGREVIGGLAAFSRAQELEADAVGLELLIAAGYEADAMSDFILAMIGQARFDAEVAGRKFDPARVDFLASHPAGAERLSVVRSAAARAPDGLIARAAHLEAINGLTWGPTGINGLIAGNRWIDRRTGLSITAPRGMSLGVSDWVVQAAAPDGRFIEFTRTRSRGADPVTLIEEVVIPSLADEFPDTVARMPVSRRIGVRPVAWVDQVLPTMAGPATMRVALVAQGREILQFIMIAPPGAPRGVLEAMTAETIESITIVPPAERSGLSPTRIRIVDVTAGDRIADFVALMPQEPMAQARFLALNNLEPGARLVPGTQLKVLRR